MIRLIGRNICNVLFDRFELFRDAAEFTVSDSQIIVDRQSCRRVLSAPIVDKLPMLHHTAQA